LAFAGPSASLSRPRASVSQNAQAARAGSAVLVRDWPPSSSNVPLATTAGAGCSPDRGSGVTEQL